MLDAQLRRSLALNRAALPLLKDHMVRESVSAVIKAELRMLASSTGAQRERTRAIPAPDPGALAVTVEQAAARLGGSRSLVFELLQRGQLKRAKKVGRRTLVTIESINVLMEEPVVALRPTAKKSKAKKSGAQLREEILTLRSSRPSKRRASRPS